jgi:hypothetical protein
MAGVKVTDLPALGTAAPDDILYIVDTTADQSRKIEVQNLFGGLPDIGGGDFTSSATISGPNDCTVTCLRALYSRVNNIVTCTYYLSIALDLGFTTGSFNIAPPVASSFTNARDAFGVLTPITDPYANLVSAVINADIGFDQIKFTIDLATAGDTLTFAANIQYIII